MDSINLRRLGSLTYKDPKPFLLELRKLELELASKELSKKVRALRTNSLNEYRQLREAALFCYFMGQRIGTTIYLAKDESQDYDFVTKWSDGDYTSYSPVQLKEIPPADINSNIDLDEIISNLKKYTDSKNLVVAIHLNRQLRFEPKELAIPSLNIAELWIFGAVSPDQNKWGLWGDFLQSPVGIQFEYPTE